MRPRLGALTALAIWALAPATAGANLTPPPPPIAPTPTLTWEVKGTVNALERSGNTVFAGGGFEYVGPPNAQLGAVVSPATGEAPLGLPRIIGTEVRTAVPDGGGGWFIGGRFTSVGGRACANVAHVRADLTVDPAFCGTMDAGPGSQAGTAVNALAVSGSLLYVGGRFGRIRGTERSNLAALSLSTGQVASFNAGALAWTETIPGLQGCQRECTPEVHALAVGPSLFVGGNFTSIGGAARWGLAGLDPTTGAVRTTFTTRPSRFGTGQRTPTQDGDEFEYQVAVRALAVNGGRLYLGGDFDKINGTAQESEPRRDGIAALDASTGALVTAFAVRVPLTLASGANVQAITVVGNVVFVGGHFSSVVSTGSAPAPRTNLAAISTNGAVLPWQPNPNDDVRSMAVHGVGVVVGGRFTTISGQPRDGLAAVIVPALSPQGALIPWNPLPHYNFGTTPRVVNAVAAGGGTIYAGGTFDAIGGIRRTSLAAFDLTTGRPTAWAPAVTRADGVGTVSALARAGNTLYVAGDFDTVAGAAREKLAAVTTDTAALLPWHPPAIAPGPNNRILTLAASPTAVFAGGDFVNGFGAPVNLAVALDPTTGAQLTWPGAPAGILQSGRPSVLRMLLSGPTLFMVGNFAGLGTSARRGIIGVDAANGAVTPFDAALTASGPPRDLAVRALAQGGSRVYVVGPSVTVGGQGRFGAAAFDGATGALDPWAPAPGALGGGTAQSVLVSGPDLVTGTSTGALRSFSLDAPAVPGTFSATASAGILDLISGPDGSRRVLDDRRPGPAGDRRLPAHAGGVRGREHRGGGQARPVVGAGPLPPPGGAALRRGGDAPRGRNPRRAGHRADAPHDPRRRLTAGGVPPDPARARPPPGPGPGARRGTGGIHGRPPAGHDRPAPVHADDAPRRLIRRRRAAASSLDRAELLPEAGHRLGVRKGALSS